MASKVEVEVERLRERVAALEKEIAGLKAPGREPTVVVLRTIDRDQAKQEIVDLFATGETLHYSDIAQRLRLDLPLVVDICNELLREGEVQVDDDALREG